MKKFIFFSTIFLLLTMQSSSAQLFCTSERKIKVADKNIKSLSFHPKLKILSYVSDGDDPINKKITLLRFDTKQPEPLKTITFPFLKSLAWNPKQNQFTTIFLNSFKVWEYNEQNNNIIEFGLRYTLDNPPSTFLDMQWNPKKDSVFALSTAYEKILVGAFLKQKPVCLNYITTEPNTANYLSWDHSGTIIVYTNRDNHIHLLKFNDALTKIQSTKDFTFNETVTHLAWHPQYPILACSHNNTALSIYHFDYKKNQLTLLKTINKDFETITALTWHAEKLTLFIAEGMQTLRVLEFLYYPKNYFENVPTDHSDTIITCDSHE